MYEQIINGIINENLNKVDQELVIKDTQPLDSAESSKILAEYLTRILREIYCYILNTSSLNLNAGLLGYELLEPLKLKGKG